MRSGSVAQGGFLSVTWRARRPRPPAEAAVMDRPLFLFGILAAALGAVVPAAAADAPPSALDELVAANRVLAHEDIVDGSVT